MPTTRNILLFIDWYEPGYKAGGPVRSCANMIAQLQNEPCFFYVVTRDTEYQSDTPYPDIVSNRWIQRGSNVKVMYLSADKISYSTLKQIVSTTPFDVAYINGMYSWWFSIMPVWIVKRYSTKQIIVSPRGMLSEGSVGVKSRKKTIFLYLARVVGLFSSVRFHATAPVEATDIVRFFGKKTTIHTMPNFPTFIPQQLPQRPNKKRNEVKLLCIARISPEKNIHYALECLQKTTNKGIITFNIYGSVYNTDYLQLCQNIASQQPEHVKIQFHDAIAPHEINTLLQNHHFLLLPSTGENYGHIIVESMAQGCPPIISNRTPWQQLQTQQAGWDIQLEQKDQFVQAIEQCSAMDNETYTSLCSGAHRYIQQNTDTDNIKRSYLNLFFQ